MKLALALAVLLIPLQQQTFYTASAKPKMPPRATAQPLPSGFFYSGGRNGHHRPRPQPSAHPAPRHT